MEDLIKLANHFKPTFRSNPSTESRLQRHLPLSREVPTHMHRTFGSHLQRLGREYQTSLNLSSKKSSTWVKTMTTKLIFSQLKWLKILLKVGRSSSNGQALEPNPFPGPIKKHRSQKKKAKSITSLTSLLGLPQLGLQP